MNFKNVLLVLMLGFTMQATAQLDCNCTTDYAPVCAVDSSGTYVEFPNTCWANCLGFTVVTDTTLCDNSNPWGDCGCVITDSTYVCAADSIGNIFPVPNACFAACWGLTVVTDSTSCDGWGGCVCPEIYDPVCAVDSLGNYYEAPNACYAACWGMTVVTDSTLCDFGNGDCGCVITDSTYVCATDSIGNIFPVPNACFAACWGLTVVENGDCDTNPWEDCDCEFDENEPFICAVDSLGHPCYVPNACYAACWGLTVTNDSICNVTDIDPEIDYDILNCIDSLYLTENTTFQEALLLISQSCGLELPVCIAVAPLFTTDSAFIAFIIANCDGVFGFNGNSSGPNVMNIYNVVNNSRLSSTGDIKAYPSELTLAANPVQQQLSYHIQVKSALDATISLLNINGQTIFKENVSLAPGKQSFSRDISGLKSGVYLLNLSSGTQQQTVRVVVVQ